MLPHAYPFKSSDDVAAFEAYTAFMARKHFYVFRRIMRPNMLWGWFAERLSLELQQFYEDFIAGKRPKLGLSCPPQHGKSIAAEDFIAWIAGKHPEFKTIYASYADELGVYRNRNLQRMFRSPAYQMIFPDFVIGKTGWACNTEQVDYCGHEGSFRNTTVNGSVNGLEIHFGVLDDPIKGRAEALSPTISDRTWSWFTDDWLSRFSNNSAQLIIMTRWALDDVVGRYKNVLENDLRMVEYPAIAEKTDRYRKIGEPLFPELKDISFLLDRKKVMPNSSWVSEYQQKPIAEGGGMFPISLLRVMPIFDSKDIISSVRAVDKAGTDEQAKGAYTALVLMHKMFDGRFVIENVTRGRWEYYERERHLRDTVDADWQRLRLLHIDYQIAVEVEPGSGGKESATSTTRNLAGYRVQLNRPTGAKERRAEPLSAQVAAGNVWLVAGTWIADFLAECEAFPNSRYKDQVDAAALAFNTLAGMSQDGIDIEHKYEYTLDGFR